MFIVLNINDSFHALYYTDKLRKVNLTQVVNRDCNQETLERYSKQKGAKNALSAGHILADRPAPLKAITAESE